MKYMTKKWYKEDMIKYHFSMNLEIIDGDKNNLEEIFLNQYKKTFDNMKSQLPENYEEYVFESIFNGSVENTKKFFDSETLNKVADIRLLALGKVFKEEYDFVEKEILKKDAMQAYDKTFKEIEDRIPVNIKENLYLHDSLITNIIKEKDKLVVELDTSGSFADVKAIIFEDYEIIEEEMNFENGWWLYEEIYIINNKYEIHSLIDVVKNNKSNLGYFTVKAKNISFK